jgi:hypothetical protein
MMPEDLCFGIIFWLPVDGAEYSTLVSFDPAGVFKPLALGPPMSNSPSAGNGRTLSYERNILSYVKQSHLINYSFDE